MKKLATLLVTLLITITSFAQPESINYKAVIKDANGNVAANEILNVKFTILKNSDDSIVYEETHTNETTDANGIMIVNIGEGTSSGSLINVDWGSDIHILKTEIDLEQDDSFVNLGQTPFNAVPYALYAPDLSTGLELITEEAAPGVFNIGWRLKNVDPNVFGPIGLFALDLTLGGSQTNDFGATGFYSVAIGSSVRASGQLAISIGNNTNAESYLGTAMGSYNIGGGTNNSWFPEDPLFEIGNGINNNNRSNALTILKNGTIIAPSLTNAFITTAGNKALITKEYLDANVPEAPSGLEQITEGINTGWRLKGFIPNNYGNIGADAVDLSHSTTGSGTKGATGPNSTAMGLNTIASNSNSTAIGKYNVNDPNAIFMVGNGSSEASRNNAFTVYNNGTSKFDGAVTINNTLLVNDIEATGSILMNFNSEVQNPNTGFANLVPIAYGSVSGNLTPTVVGGTGNFTVTRNTLNNEYTISVAGKTLNNNNTVTSVVANTSTFRTVNATYVGGNLVVHIFASSFEKVISPFQFTIYQE